MENAIEVKNLTKRYKDFTLDHISFSLPKGMILGLIGENGAGKSTFINSLLGIVKSEYEQIQSLGLDLASHEKQIKGDIAAIFDDARYDENFTPLFIGKIMAGIYRNWDSQKYQNYLKQFSLPPKKKLKTFSKGMKTKLEFAAALSHNPKLLILDEATSGLDPIFRDEILDIIREFCENEEHSVLISSHITSDLDKIADYVAYIHQGKLQFFKTYDEIQTQYGILNCGREFFENISKDDILAYRREAYSYQVLIRNRQEFKTIFRDTPIQNASLEDIMLFYSKGERML